MEYSETQTINCWYLRSFRPCLWQHLYIKQNTEVIYIKQNKCKLPCISSGNTFTLCKRISFPFLFATLCHPPLGALIKLPTFGTAIALAMGILFRRFVAAFLMMTCTAFTAKTSPETLSSSSPAHSPFYIFDFKFGFKLRVNVGQATKSNSKTKAI